MHEFELPAGFLDGEPPSWYAVVRPMELQPPSYDGAPRRAAEGAQPRILILEAGGESDVFVSYYAEDLGYLTDEWFPTREAAVGCFEKAFAGLGPWNPIPSDVVHPESFVLHQLAT